MGRQSRAGSRTRWAAGLIVCGLALLSSAWLVTASRELGPTYDEPFYVQAGLESWRTGHASSLLSAGTMPLPAEVQTAPLWLAERVRGRPWVWSRDLDRMLALSRAGTLAFWWLLLGSAAWLAASAAGPWAGVLAASLIALEPSFLAHAGLATADIAVSACLALFACVFHAGRDRGWLRRVGAPALAFAVAVVAKASALALGPLVMIVLEVVRHLDAVMTPVAGTAGGTRAARAWRAVRSTCADGATIAGAGVMLAMVYCGMGEGPAFQGTLARLSPDAPLRPIIEWVGGLPLMPNGLYALWYQYDHNRSGQPTYLLGHEDAHALWFYVPVVAAIKLSAPLWLSVLGAIAAPGRRWRFALGLVAGVVVLMGLVRVQLGIRVLLPALALLLVAVAVRVAGALAHGDPPWRRGLSAVIMAGMGWLAVEDLQAWPDAIRYVSPVWGGADRRAAWLSDSNYDWGQGLPEVAAWQRAHAAPVAVWYCGNDPRGFGLQPFDPAEEGVRGLPPGTYLAVGATCLYRATPPAAGEAALTRRLRERRPVDRTRTFLIFDGVAP